MATADRPVDAPGRPANPLRHACDAAPGDHRQVAIELAGFAPVFPCWPDKTPATKRGFKDATDDPERIHRWWARHPDHLVGIPTDGLLVVDLDIPSDSRPPDTAWHTWARLAGPHRWDPAEAVMAATPSGGLHIYHTQPPGIRVRNSAGKLGPYIDVRATGGYVIAPGSTLPDGSRYELLRPGAGTVPVAPAWLTQACQQSPSPATAAEGGPTDHAAGVGGNAGGGTTYGCQALDAELGRLATAAIGARNDTLVRSAYRAGQLVAGGQLDLAHAASQLLAVALRIGLSETESAATVRSGLAAGARNPRSPAA